MALKKFLPFFLSSVFIFLAAQTFAQAPNVLISGNKAACRDITPPPGLDNGEITILVSPPPGIAPFTLFIFGPDNYLNIPLTAGTPFTLSTLQPGNYLVIVQDGGPTDFFGNFTIGSTTDITASVAPLYPVNNTDCVSPNGEILLDVLGGTGTYNFGWTTTSGTPASGINPTGLAGGDYDVIVSDAGSNCSQTISNIILTDPSPVVQNVTPLSGTLSVCAGSNAVIGLDDTEIFVPVTFPIQYEIYNNGSPTGVIVNGTGVAISLILPSGSFASGDVLTVIGSNGLCSPVPMNGSVTVTIDPLPTVNAGPDQTICAGGTVTLAGSIGGSATLATWSGGAGTFVPNNTTLNAVYTPSAAEVTAGTVTLTLTTNDPVGPCLPAIDQMIITINSIPTANAGPDQTICAGSTVTLVGSIGGAATIGTWSGGAGTFVPNNTTLNAVYTPSAAEVTAGTVTLTLTTNDPAGPCVPAIDQMIITINPAATANAGPDQTICAGSTVTLAGTLGGSATVGTWIGGAGTFVPNNTTLNAVYTPSAAEVTAGTVTLTLTTNDPIGPCPLAFDQMIITINSIPTVNAGPDQTICAGSAVSLAGSMGGSAVSATWSGGTGTFVPNNTTLNAVYTPSAAEVTAGTVTLTLTTNDPAGPCVPAVDQVIITINPAATVNAGPDQAVCAGSTVTLAGSMGGSATLGTWSGGAGTFAPNNTTLNAVYTPSAAEVTAGTVTLTLTTNDPAGPCPLATDQVIITINSVATVNAGPDQTICAGSAVTLAGSIGGSAVSATWSGGAGTFVPNNTTLNAVYTPNAAEVTAGTVTLTLTTNDPAGPCVAAVDQLIITINPAATVNAGPDQAVCSGSTVTLAGSMGGSATLGTWSGGAGTFAPNNTTLNAVYTPSAAEVTAGTVTLTLTTNDPAGPCPLATDQVIITINSVATVNAGPDQTICAGSAVTLAGSIGGSAVSATWSGGAGTFAPNNTTLNAVYTPNAAEVTAGTVTLTLTTNDPAGPCVAAVDQVIITINPAATVNAGPDQAVCSGSTVTLAGSMGGSATLGTWSGGAGTFAPNNTTLNAVYTPSAAEVTAGTVTLTLTTNDPAGPCPLATDQVIITINAVATVNAGPDQTICASGTVTLAGSIGGSATIGTWSGGTGTFAPNNTTLNAVYTPSAAEVTAGTVTLTLTTNDPAGPCLAATDQMNITIQTAAGGTLSGNASICIGQSASLTITFTGPGPTWDFTYSDGSTTFNGTAGTSPFSISVSPLITTNYTLVSVTDATCGAGTVSGGATVVVNPIPGNPATFGVETWLGYVYDDSATPAPPTTNINFIGTKYRGFIDENDIDNMSAASTYNVATDVFDLNLGTNPINGPNVCGSYPDDFSVRYRMRKTFAAGTYTFSVGADDGVRLLIDGVNVITDPTAFDIHAYTVYTTDPICITAGQHDLVIEYFEQGIDARVSFDYALVSAPTVTSPVDVCVNTATPTLGATSVDPFVLDFNWYTDAALTNLVFTGANYTPASTELDMTVAATTDFFVTSVYAGGCESPASTMVVNVVSSAALTLPPTAICETGGIVDLTTIASATPSGGVFVFTGHPNISGNNFDPLGLSGLVSITVDYSIGGCSAPTGTLDLTITNSASITVPGAAVQACETGGTIDLTTLVSGAPTGGVFVFSGPQVTGNVFDPSGLSGLQTILVDYSSGGCVAPQAQFDIDVSTTAALTITDSNVCEDAGIVSLLTFVSATPSGGVFSFSGTGVAGSNFDPTGLTGPIAISVTYTGVCSAAGTLTLTVLDPSDPLCGGGVNCNVFTVTISDTRPSCVSQDDGTITINVSGGVPNYIVTLTAPGFSQALPGPPGSFVFNNLSPDNYQYTIQDIGGNVCTLPYSLPLQTNVDASASGFVDATCFGEPTGQALLTVNSGGTAPFEYSLDGLVWVTFTSPHLITTLPPNGTYSILVRDDASDLCPDQVSVTIDAVNAEITQLFSVQPATCNNNDGKIVLNGLPGGGGGGPYSYLVDGAPVVPVANEISNLTSGAHVFSVVDGSSGCQQDFNITITFPGFVNTTPPVVTNPDCAGNGSNGSIVVDILDIGAFEFAVSTDPLFVPTATDFVTTGGPTVIIPNLSNGTYYVWLQSLGAQCPTRLAPITINGVVAVSFTGASTTEICFGDGGTIVLSNILGALNLDYSLEINGTVTNTISFATSLSGFTETGLAPGPYQVRLIQDQTALNGCVVSTGFQSLTIDGPNAALGITSVSSTLSFPDQPTGSILVVVQESEEEDYEVWITSNTFESDTLIAAENPVQFEASFANLDVNTYTVYVRDALGCEVEQDVTIAVDPTVFVPNIFTPNNDGVNDSFYVRNLPESGSKLSITNRWGKEVFASNNYYYINEGDNTLWDGGGSPDGVYFYRLQISGGKTFTGWVEILRGSKP